MGRKLAFTREVGYGSRHCSGIIGLSYVGGTHLVGHVVIQDVVWEVCSVIIKVEAMEAVYLLWLTSVIDGLEEHWVGWASGRLLLLNAVQDIVDATLEHIQKDAPGT